ncbi:hypothetical protein L596_009057 [Steinernema carpocapsae]|uniref:CUB domain-containing protein n=1 Tax=Steinernema carpocapsae TaxID=34508 RepID=A0A4U5PEB9_STECR|nr:hypothetical protein L596_009057 [Steinernema carpocapsae]
MYHAVAPDDPRFVASFRDLGPSAASGVPSSCFWFFTLPDNHTLKVTFLAWKSTSGGDYVTISVDFGPTIHFLESR